MTRSAARQFLLAITISVVGLLSFHGSANADAGALWACSSAWSSCLATYGSNEGGRWACNNNAVTCITGISWEVQMLECDAWRYCYWDCSGAYVACMQNADGDSEMENLCGEGNSSCISACGPQNCQ